MNLLTQNLLQTRIKQRLEVIESYRNQIEEKRRRYEQDQIEQESYRKEMMEKYSQDKRLEQMNAQKRRMRQLEHRRAVEALIEERRRNSVELLDFEKEMLLKEKEIQKYKDEVVEQERQRLLRDHAVGLANFLPKGVLRDEKDLELFDQNFKERFEKGLQTK